MNAGSYTTGDFGVADGYHGSETAASGFANSSDHQAASGRPDDTRGAAFRSRVSLCPVGWYCTGDGGGSECPPGLYGSEVSRCHDVAVDGSARAPQSQDHAQAASGGVGLQHVVPTMPQNGRLDRVTWNRDRPPSIDINIL